MDNALQFDENELQVLGQIFAWVQKGQNTSIGGAYKQALRQGLRRSFKSFKTAAAVAEDKMPELE